ncbi:unnamed protein product [Nezara viridula]|uniref:Uncharacterized protein n=1 Tax=Nezara viridula TaxID=85310 RepID=A0A9P0ECN4_NEZVI|nr:unnamed protein product [Nezara viridula]
MRYRSMPSICYRPAGDTRSTLTLNDNQLMSHQIFRRDSLELFETWREMPVEFMIPPPVVSPPSFILFLKILKCTRRWRKWPLS